MALYAYMQIVHRRKEGNVLFNNALNTFYLRLNGVDYIVKDHSNSERGNPLQPHGLLFPISSKVGFFFKAPSHMAFVTPVEMHWLEREIAVHRKQISNSWIIFRD